MIKIFDDMQYYLATMVEVADINQADYDQCVLDELVQQYSSLQFEQGSVILLLFPNSKALLQHICALLLVGYVPALVAPSTPIYRINMIANSFNAKAISKFKIVNNNFENLRKLIRFNKFDLAVLDSSHELLTQPGEVILTTSGTSGFSSGCLFDFLSLIKNAEKHADIINLSNNDAMLVNLPLFYSYAFVAQALASFVRKARLVISEPPFNCSRYISDIKKHNITVSSITPVLIKELLNNHIEMTRSLRVLTVGGDKLDVKHIEAVLKNNFSQELYLTYGITEAGPRVATLAAHMESHNKFASVGKLLPGTSAILYNQSDSNSKNELLIHSDTLVKKRLGNSTKPLFIDINDKKWLRSGDIFTIEDGYLYYQNRISDFVIIHGEKVNLNSIKQLAMQCYGAITVKTNITNNNNLLNFDLDILISRNFDKDLKKIKNMFISQLKIFERPRNIEINYISEDGIKVYK